MSQGPGQAGSGESGFALVLVILGVGLISLLLLASITAARWRVMAAANTAAAAQAAHLAEAAAMIGGARLTAANPAGAAPSFDGRPALCALPGGARAGIAIEDEGGKVDLNGAPPKLLEALFTGFGVEAGAAADIARAIADFRTVSPGRFGAAAEPGAAATPKHALFQTIFELDQVAAVPPGLARDLAPYLTVSSARAGLDPAVAPPALFAALSGAALSDVRGLAAVPYPNRLDRTDPRFPLSFIQGTPGGVYLVHAEAVMASGVIAVRELLVDVRLPGGGFKIHERRGGVARFGEPLRALLMQGAVPDC